MDIVTVVYRITAEFPVEERYGLTSQLRRAAVSLPTNIAEGEGRATKKEFAHFLTIAYGSMREVETLLEIAVRVGILANAAAQDLAEKLGELGRILNGLRNSIRAER